MIRRGASKVSPVGQEKQALTYVLVACPLTTTTSHVTTAVVSVNKEQTEASVVSRMDG